MLDSGNFAATILQGCATSPKCALRFPLFISSLITSVPAIAKCSCDLCAPHVYCARNVLPNFFFFACFF